MQILYVENDEAVLEQTAEMCLYLAQVEGIEAFTEQEEVLEWLEDKENQADLALLTIDMPRLNGLELAEKIQFKRPDMKIVFLAESGEYAVDAFALHVSGYLVKPVSAGQLAREIMYAGSASVQTQSTHITVHTFGEFDVEVNGDVVRFARARSKELLAYLVDRQGRTITRANAFSVLWEDEFYDRPMQKQMDVIVRSLRDTLKNYGIDEIFELKRGTMRVVPERFECDLYRFFEGDVDAVNQFRGEYMSAYPWASMTESYMDRISGNY